MPALGGGQEVLSQMAQNHVVVPDAFARTLYINQHQRGRVVAEATTVAAIAEHELPQMV